MLGSTQLPSNVDLAIWQGDAQLFGIELAGAGGAEIDLTGLVPSAVIRKDFSATTSYPFVCTLDGSRIKLYLSSATTKAMEAGSYIWNLQMTSSNGDVRTYIAGDVTVYAEVDH